MMTKKCFTIGLILLALCLMQGVAEAQFSSSSCMSSGEITSTTQVCTGTTCRLCGIEVYTNGTVDAYCPAYNGTAATDVAVTKGGPVAGTSKWGGVTYEVPRRMNKGIRVIPSGTGASCIVHYDK